MLKNIDSSVLAVLLAVGVCFPSQAQTRHVHDELNRLTSLSSLNGAGEQIEYDASGNVKRRTRAAKREPTPWITVFFQTSMNFMPVRVNQQGDVECASDDGLNCYWGTTAEQTGDPAKPAVCPAEMYENLAHWCGESMQVLRARWLDIPGFGKQYASVSCGRWYSCEAKARLGGWHLVSIGSQAENDALAEHFDMRLNRWIGATNDGVPDRWRWTDGAPFVYTNWGGNLNNEGGNENCAHFYDVTPGFWNDLVCDSPGVTWALIERLR